MKGDFSRLTFQPEKHYSGVLMQQGRVGLDADWNEQQSIQRYQGESRAADIIGDSGAPREDPGFELVPQGNDLLIKKGHFYIDGILCENDADLVLSNQTGIILPADQDGLFLAFLEVWQRHITSLEDGEIRETALGGPDTTTRSQTVWQVRLLKVTPPAGTLSCASAFPEWDQLLAQRAFPPDQAGKLTPSTAAGGVTDDPACILPPTSGYQRLENQLYRVEIHTGGSLSQARFKWSRENGSVVVPVTNINGSEITLADMGKDEVLGFDRSLWVELSDDRLELSQQHGYLVKVKTPDRATRTLKLETTAPTDVNTQLHATARRWEQGGDSDQGLPMDAGLVALEGGIQVAFSAGTYKAGDYWLIPARTAINADTGTIDWPFDETAQAFLPLPPYGNRHHFTRLALFNRNAGTFDLATRLDCRTVFPALTGIEARDVRFDNTTCNLTDAVTVQEALDLLCQRGSGGCMLQIVPGEDAAAALAGLTAGQDAHICFQTGVYNLPAPLDIKGMGHLLVTGEGFGTRLVAPGAESAFIFENCRSVTVRDCTFEAGISGSGSAATDFLNGALTFIDCGSVNIEYASVKCASAPSRSSTCITVRNLPAAPTIVRIRACDLEVGHQQAGVLLVNTSRVQVEDNLLHAGPRPASDVLLKDKNYLALLRRNLMAGMVLGPIADPATSGTNATVTFNGQVVNFRTDPALVRGNRNDNSWQNAITARNPGKITSPLALKTFLTQLASDVIAAQGNLPGIPASLRGLVTTLMNEDIATASQGIVVGGETAIDVRILNNTLLDFIQGVHVGVSRHELAPGPASTAEAVIVSGNTIRVQLSTTATRERHAIFAGNCRSLLVLDNYLTLQRTSKTARLRVEGIRVFGSVDRRVVIRQNHLASGVTGAPGFSVGVRFQPAATFQKPQWIITDNLAVGATQVVDTPANVRPLVRGVDDNFA